MTEKLAPSKRHKFVHNGQTIFEWDQTLEEVNLYISLPKEVPKKLFSCSIKTKHVDVGIKGNPPYLNHDLAGPVKLDSSFWTIEDDIMHIFLQKREKGQPWPSAIVGQGELDPYTADQEQRRLMLQRFQEEYGFGIRSQSNWSVKDTRSMVCTSYRIPGLWLITFPLLPSTTYGMPALAYKGNVIGSLFRKRHPRGQPSHWSWYTWTCAGLCKTLLLVAHPGFDFSQAEFSGSCPNPKTFMGGIKP